MESHRRKHAHWSIVFLISERTYTATHVPCVAITDHKATTAVMSGKEFETERLNGLHAELREYAIHVCYRPGRLLTLADFTSRAHVEQDPDTRQQMADELLQWRATQEANAMREVDQEQHAKVMKRIKSDAMIGERPFIWRQPTTPAIYSRAIIVRGQ